MIEFDAISLQTFPPNLTLYNIILDIMPILGIVSAIAYYIVISRNANKTRKAQLFMQLYENFQRPDFWKRYGEIIFLHEYNDFEDWWERYGPENIDTFSSWMSFGTYFCGIGVLIKSNLIDIDLVDDLLGDYVIWVWKKWEPLMKEFGEGVERPQSVVWVEYLYNELKKKREKEASRGII